MKNRCLHHSFTAHTLLHKMQIMCNTGDERKDTLNCLQDRNIYGKIKEKAEFSAFSKYLLKALCLNKHTSCLDYYFNF